MRVLVCGSRNWNNYRAIYDVLKPLSKRIKYVIEGEAPGADRLGRQAAIELGIKYLPFPANWDKYGKAAGSIRNQEMLDEGRPDLVFAFHIGDSRGTWDMLRRAAKAGIPAWRINEKGICVSYS